MNDLILKKHDKNYYKSVRNMINTIIEVLKFNKNLDECCSSMSSEHLAMMIDYITLLEHTNEELNRMCELYSKSLYNAELTDYKSRCEKAIEYIMSDLITEWDIENDGCVSGSDLPVDAITPILNILNGVDEK